LRANGRSERPSQDRGLRLALAAPAGQEDLRLDRRAAAAERISKSYVARLLRPAKLAPALVETILTGKLGPSVGLEQLMQALPMSWEEQRRLLAARSAAAV
jgi:hypothetical protein